MKSHKWSRRTFYLAAVVAIVASTSGFALASVLSTPTTITQGSEFYAAQGSGLVNWQPPTLGMGQSVASSCSGPTVVEGSTGQTVNLELSAYDGGTNCTTGNFAEVFTIDYTAPSVSTQSTNLTIYTHLTGEPVQVSYVTLVLGTGSPGAFTANVNVIVDYGMTNPPNQGIPFLELLMH